MRRSTKRQLAVAAMIDLAIHEQAGPVPLAMIAKRQQASVTSLEQLFLGLRKAGLVEGTRGHGGGYNLAREVTDISVSDIVEAVEVAMPCARARDAGPGLADDLLQRLNTVMNKHMATISLSNLAVEHRKPDGAPQLPMRRSAALPGQVPRPVAPDTAATPAPARVGWMATAGGPFSS